jgi:hypothetical protein
MHSVRQGCRNSGGLLSRLLEDPVAEQPDRALGAARCRKNQIVVETGIACDIEKLNQFAAVELDLEKGWRGERDAVACKGKTYGHVLGFDVDAAPSDRCSLWKPWHLKPYLPPFVGGCDPCVKIDVGRCLRSSFARDRVGCTPP